MRIKRPHHLRQGDEAKGQAIRAQGGCLGTNKILEYFIKNPNQILSREQILLKVWGFDYKGQERSVDTHIKILRKALGPYQKGIKTVIKQGYCFETKVFENG